MIARRANICAMKAEAVDRFYNVGTGKRTSLQEIAEKLLALTGSNQPINYAPRSQATLVRNRIGSPKRAKRRDRLRGADRSPGWPCELDCLARVPTSKRSTAAAPNRRSDSECRSES